MKGIGIRSERSERPCWGSWRPYDLPNRGVLHLFARIPAVSIATVTVAAGPPDAREIR